MKLYYFPVAPNPSRVIFFLNEKSRWQPPADKTIEHPVLQADQVERVLINLLDSAQRTPKFLALNPAGSLPALELDDGTVLSESVPIMEYLEELLPQPSLIGSNPLQRAEIRAVERKIELGFFQRVMRAVHATRSPLGLPPNPALAQHELAALPAALTWIDTQIGDSEFVMGAAPTMADCTLLAAMNFARFGQIEIAAEYANLWRWFNSYALRHL
jgi:glutathione S-transferase